MLSQNPYSVDLNASHHVAHELCNTYSDSIEAMLLCKEKIARGRQLGSDGRTGLY
jgi:hypothetical protein